METVPNILAITLDQAVLNTVLKVLIVFAVVMPCIAYAVYFERRISAFIQDRTGPNRVGWFGLLQPLADGLKSFLKEDFTPGHVRKLFYWMAPAITMIPAFLTFAVIPFGSTLGNPDNPMVIADLNVGILYTFGIVSLSVYGIVLAGYGSNSKYPFLGGIRSSAQMISYELAMGLSVIPVLMVVGNLNLSEIVEYQAVNGWIAVPFMAGEHNWQSYVLWIPLGISFVIFLIAAFAETNRLPFDMPESETELVAGYNTEYSSMKFALFFLGEYAAMISISALMVTLFFGGWTLPVPLGESLSGTFSWLREDANSFWAGLVHIVVFMLKMFVFMGAFIWTRWMLPRFRYDQLMDLGWRVFLPVAILNIIGTAILLFVFR